MLAALQSSWLIDPLIFQRQPLSDQISQLRSSRFSQSWTCQSWLHHMTSSDLLRLPSTQRWFLIHSFASSGIAFSKLVA
ncbi:hypothetical protein QL285_034911 [Trifolium repens]|nr:hypothetical protein QL285_034911 [Trifolium repens]